MDKKSIDFCYIHEIIPQNILFQLFLPTTSHDISINSILFWRIFTKIYRFEII